MEPKFYKILGFILIGLSIVLAVWMVPGFGNDKSIWVDGIWFMMIGLISILALGALYLMFGFNKIKTSRLSDISVKFIFSGIFASLIGVPVVLILVVAKSDPMGLILMIPVILFSFFMAVIALVLAIIAAIKKE